MTRYEKDLVAILVGLALFIATYELGYHYGVAHSVAIANSGAPTTSLLTPQEQRP
jgi:hypothetical protein